ncbi:MAG TPA: hypothetical protein ENJ09_16385 [Planctomycetes bacterium]|nr:hypothetical protein [Planctomycetota bacterium]
MLSFILVCASGFSGLGAPSVPVAVEAPVADTGSISGKVVWEGDRPDPRPPLKIKDTETKGCIHEGGVDTEDRTLLIDANGGVANVVLTIKATDVKVPESPIELDQKGCRFEPRVIVVPVGATVRYANSDETNHNIHTFAKKNQPLNKNVAGGTHLEQTFSKAEVVEVKCDVHTWMKSYVVVTDASNFAVSARDGSFKIEGLPPGEYKVEWWHEELGKGKTETIKVEAGKDSPMTLKVSASSKKKKGGRRRR